MIRKYRLSMILTALLPTLPATSFAQSGNEPAADGASAGVSQSDRIARVQGQNTSFVKKAEPQQARQPQTRSHQVVAGDTLWQLSSEYLSDPFMWPALWSYNPQVTNPHWIYPGDTIYLEPHADAAALTTAPQETKKTEFVTTASVGAGSFFVPGFYIDKLPDSVGHILYSDQEKHMIAPGDDVQVDWADIEMRKKVKNGQRFTVFSQSKPVINEDGDEMAYKLIRQGTIEIVDRREDTLSTARVVQASREIERGMIIIPNEDLTFSVVKTPNSKSQEGRVIDTIDIITQIATEQFVIINRGRNEGVVPGNRWVVFEQREGLSLLKRGKATQTQYAETEEDKNDLRNGKIYREDEQSWVLGREVEMHIFPERDDLSDIYGDRDYTTADLPLKKIGEILVVDSRDKFSTGLIISSAREVGIDTRVVMIKGY